nr:biotin/lipoyl-binding protein [Lautropia sp.]
HYDPMIAKLITWGEDRDTARRTMAQALAGLQVVGPSTNVDFLRRLMANPAFASADLDTGLIERERAALLPPPQPASDAELALAAAAVLANELDGPDPWSVHGGWRLGAPLQRRLVFTDGGGQREVILTYGKGGCTILPAAADGADSPMVFLPRPASPQAGDRRFNPQASAQCALQVGLQVGSERHEASAVFDHETLHLFTATRHLRLEYVDKLAHAGEAAQEGGRLTAPMPGKVIALLVRAGSTVSKGDPLLVMEAMKMEHTITAPTDGTVARLHYAVGDQVAEGEALVAIDQPPYAIDPPLDAPSD